MIEVKQITYKDCVPFILEIHYARRIPVIQYAYGIFIDGKLCGVVTYGPPASPSLCRGVAGVEFKDKVLELNRLVILPDVQEKNVASQLIGRSLKLLPKGLIIVSYADCEGWGHVGYVYQATNWYYTGKTRSRTDRFSKGHARHYDKNESARKYRTSKYRYLFITGKHKDKILKYIKYPIIKEYPKGDSIHYDINNPVPQKDISVKVEAKQCQK